MRAIDVMRIARLLSLLLVLGVAARAVELRDREQVIKLVRDAAMATTPAQLDRALRRMAANEAPCDTQSTGGGYGVLWFDNGIPRARIWLKNVAADEVFSEILIDSYLLEGIQLRGRIDVELEIKSGRTCVISGRLRLNDVALHWRQGEFALVGINGYVPITHTMGEASGTPPEAVRSETVTIHAMYWSDRPLATDLKALASYRERILRVEQIRVHAMDGEGLGSMVVDNRSPQWRAAAMLRFHDVAMSRIYEILPELPVLARVTNVRMKGDIGLIYSAPDALDLVGAVETQSPGVIVLAPRIYEKVRRHVDSSTLNFQKLTIDLGRSADGELEAKVNIHRRTAQSLAELARGVPFAPVILTVKFPIIPFVAELSQP